MTAIVALSASANHSQRDSITVLTSKGPLLTKTWGQDGTITGHGRAKQHKVTSVAVDNIFEAAALFETLRSKPRSCVVRGDYIGHAAAALIPDPDHEREAGYALRQAVYFTDPARHLLECDVDGYVPLLFDPVLEPVESIREWIKYHLPPAFQEITFYWQLSSSAGHPTKEGTLRCHVWFWMVRPFTSPEAAAWVTMAGIPVDRAPLNVVQAAYTADPVFAAGVVDPVPLRAGLVEGLFGDEVDLVIDEGALAAAMVNGRTYTPTGELIDRNDPRLKRGLIGAFCRAFSPEDVLTADWFTGNFERIDDRRWTWVDGRGAPEGIYITEDRLALVNTHNSAPDDTLRKGQNAYDVARLYMYNDLDQAVPMDDRWTWQADPMSRPSDVAMRKLARTLPGVAAELDAARSAEAAYTFAEFDGIDGGDDSPELVGTEEASGNLNGDLVPNDGKMRRSELLNRMKCVLRGIGMTNDETERAINCMPLAAAWNGCFYNGENQKLYLMNKPGALVTFPAARWTRSVVETFGQLVNHEVFIEAAERIETDAKKAEKLVGALNKVAWAEFETFVTTYRQRSAVAYKVDAFATNPSITVGDGTKAIITYPLEPFKLQPVTVDKAVAQAIVTEYRAFFPFFDVILDLLLHARFASDRRKAYLWLKCAAGFGKGFLLDGVLGRNGLGIVTPMSMDDIARGPSGDPSGVTVQELIFSWLIFVDEFKTVKSELKQINNTFTASPKGQLRFEVETFVKLFASAERVDSLAGSEGVEAQFSDRFAYHGIPDGTSGVGSLPLFKNPGKNTYRTVLANYAAEVLNAGISRMRRLGRTEASRVADDWLDQFHIDHGILKTYGALSANLPAQATAIEEIIFAWASQGDSSHKTKYLSPKLKAALGQNVEKVTGSRNKRQATESPEELVVVTNLTSLVKQYVLNGTMDDSQKRTVAYKAQEIAELIAGCSLGENSTPTRFYVLNKDGTVGPRRQVRGAVLCMFDSDTRAAQQAAFMPNVVFADFKIKGGEQ